VKQRISSQKGFTLLEVLASIVILIIMFSVLSGFFVNSAYYSNTFDKNLSSVQLSKSLLEIYQAEGFEEARKRVLYSSEKLSGEEISEKLGLPEAMFNTTDYEAAVSFLPPDPNRIQSDQLIRISVTVSAHSGKTSVSSKIEGYIRK
jgi:prepilin-type N-terminal cleavage/methylation domain-containing protein